jgi:hypothetical protein
VKKICPIEIFIKVTIGMLAIGMWTTDGPFLYWLEWAWTLFFVGIVLFINLKNNENDSGRH